MVGEATFSHSATFAITFRSTAAKYLPGLAFLSSTYLPEASVVASPIPVLPRRCFLRTDTCFESTHSAVGLESVPLKRFFCFEYFSVRSRVTNGHPLAADAAT